MTTIAFQRKSRTKAAPAVPRARMRLYRHGLGDCFLLRFGRPDGNTFNLLIDCGLISAAGGGKSKMSAVAEDIRATCNGRIDAVVMTHEHWDHVSGFSREQAQSLFDDMDIGEVWYAWTEDPSNALGTRLRAERARKVDALKVAARALGAPGNSVAALRRAAALESYLTFFGADGTDSNGPAIGKTRKAFDYLRDRDGVKVRYLHPEDAPLVLPGLPGVRIYVLGPPEDESLIKKSAPTKSGREVYEMASEAALAENVQAAFSRMGKGPASGNAASADCPFDNEWQRHPATIDCVTAPQINGLIEGTWAVPGEQWRQIDEDWTYVAETLALNLDTHTNNTCVVLAFELVDTGEVFLFPADAQVGNWLSWQNLAWTVREGGGDRKVTAKELLGRTVFYKVGHHGSHNATLRALGLELMHSDNLTAYIPVVRSEAEKNRWMGMPFGPLVKRLQDRTRGRLLQADDDALPSDGVLSDLSPAALTAFRRAAKLAPSKAFVELTYD